MILPVHRSSTLHQWSEIFTSSRATGKTKGKKSSVYESAHRKSARSFNKTFWINMALQLDPTGLYWKITEIAIKHDQREREKEERASSLTTLWSITFRDPLIWQHGRRIGSHRTVLKQCSPFAHSEKILSRIWLGVDHNKKQRSNHGWTRSHRSVLKKVER